MNVLAFMRSTLVIVGLGVLFRALGVQFYPSYASEIGLGCAIAIALTIATGLPWYTPYTARPMQATAVLMASMGCRILATVVVFVVVKRQEDLAVVPVMLAFVMCLLPFLLFEAVGVYRRFMRAQETIT